MGTENQARRWMQWVREGSDLPAMRVVQIHLRELRPTGTGTATEEWLLLELEETDE